MVVTSAAAHAAALLLRGVGQQLWQLRLLLSLLLLVLVPLPLLLLLALLLLAVVPTHWVLSRCHLSKLCLANTLAAVTVVPHVLLTPFVAALHLSQLAGMRLAGCFLQAGSVQEAGFLQAANAPGSHFAAGCVVPAGIATDN
jgi:hypothetical protein